MTTALAQVMRFTRPVGGCLEWARGLDGRGYGAIYIGTQQHRVHRVVYEELHGPIRADFVIDHLCGNRRCCHPGHLEAVTQRENLLRGRTLAARHAQTTHCPQGHPYTPENTFLKNGSRQCRECSRIRARARYQRLRAQKAG